MLWLQIQQKSYRGLPEALKEVLERIPASIRKPGKAFKFVKNLKVGEEETEIPNDWYKLDQEEQNFIINEVLQLKKGERIISLEDSKVI